MTRFPYDQFTKSYFKELLSPSGKVETSRKVAAEIKEIDVYFAPSPQESQEREKLGLLGKFAATSAVFEPFRNAVKRGEVRSCLNKLFDIFAELEREAKRNETEIVEEELPFLWILSPTASEAQLEGFRAILDEENWLSGVYLLGEFYRGAIVAIHQLPTTEETLWLRILGKGRVQQQAIQELQALPQENPLREVAMNLLSNLKTTLELKQELDQEERELIMQLSPVYEQRLAEAREQGVQQGIERGVQQGIERGVQQGTQTERRNTINTLLKGRFGTVDEELAAVIQPIIDLPAPEYSALLLQLLNLSREELLARFTRSDRS
ncbi:MULTISPECIES: RpnC/YadD family protein [Nostocales]|uniref:Flagellar assembly protein H n=3 Tax=Nostocales TaxID=1161 RepID=A0A0C1R4P7_9CYAN|nr:hypothetical protein [Tolypothrix bouteillei]KAF3890324.1 hypothetical protein DA73_0400036410 [Tolypothrix bouteillei VB521301]